MHSRTAPPSTMRAAIAAMLAAIMAIASLTLTAAPAAAAPTFSDVPRGHQFEDEIRWLADMRVTTGYADGTFRPREDVSREAFAAFLYRLTGSPRVSLPSRSPFRDVAPSAQFYREIVWLSQSGIATGWADGTFHPKAPIMREAVAAFLYRLAGEPPEPWNQDWFTDVHEGSKFRAEIIWLANAGITTGYTTRFGTRQFRPLENVSREAIAAFLYRSSDALRRPAPYTGRVGEDILPGTYVADAASAAEPFCAWATYDAQIAVPQSLAGSLSTPLRGIATVTDEDWLFRNDSCGTWRPLRATSPNATSFGDGTVVAG